MVVSGQTRAILWAQLRTFRNFQFRSGRAGLILSLLVGLVWYGVWAVAAFAAYALLREAEDVEQIRRILTPGLLLVCLYWQLIPVLMANAGMSLQIKRLLVYPIPRSQLFGLEVLLRFSTALELVILLIGACAGILFSKVLPLPCVLGFLPLVAMNLLFSAGIRDLLARVFASRKYRELATLLVVLMATLPQLALRMGIPGPWKRLFTGSPNLIWPWTATSYLATGDWHWRYWLAIALWTYAAYLFGRRQFDRNLRFDEQAANSTDTRAGKLSPLADLIFRWPSKWLRDPLAALIEKELRTLLRSPRVRIIFLMSLLICLIVWTPMVLRKSASFLDEYYLPFLCVYSMLITGEVCVWNVLGFDRSAGSIYWLAPTTFPPVLIAKNICSVLFTATQIAVITIACLLLRMPLPVSTIAETAVVCMLFLLLLISAGNVVSLRFPRPMDPNQGWRRSSGSRIQMMLLLAYPLLALPFAFAYFARSAWESNTVFYVLVAFIAALAGAAYGYSIELCTRIAGERKENILAALAQGDGPIVS